MFALDLWDISGHAAKYKDDMFLLGAGPHNMDYLPTRWP